MGTQVSFPGLGLELTVFETAFTLFGLEIKWYAILIAAGILLALYFAFRHAREFGIDSEQFLDVALVAIVAAVIGARLSYVLFSEHDYGSFWEVINFRDGGLMFYGGVAFGILAAVFACRKHKMQFWAVADIAALGLLIGQGIGRWGNFVNQEAFGKNTTLPWGMYSNETAYYLMNKAADLADKGMPVSPSMPVHPTFLYESLWCAAGFAVLYFYMRKRKFDGELFLLYVVWNGFGRAYIEGLRTDSLYIGNSALRVSQVLAIAGALAAIGIVLYLRRKIALSDDERYLKPYGYTKEAEEALEQLRVTRQRIEEEKAARLQKRQETVPAKKATEEARGAAALSKEEPSSVHESAASAKGTKSGVKAPAGQTQKSAGKGTGAAKASKAAAAADQAAAETAFPAEAKKAETKGTASAKGTKSGVKAPAGQPQKSAGKGTGAAKASKGAAAAAQAAAGTALPAEAKKAETKGTTSAKGTKSGVKAPAGQPQKSAGKGTGAAKASKGAAAADQAAAETAFPAEAKKAETKGTASAKGKRHKAVRQRAAEEKRDPAQKVLRRRK